ncbi:MAG: flavin reductase [Bacilli bacterium]
MKKINYSIIAGVYVLSTDGSACIVDAVSQVSAGENPLIAVSVNKNNYTNEMMRKNNRFSLSILSKDVNGNIIKTFGFSSSRDINKFENIEFKEIDELKVVNDSIGYMTFEKVNELDCDTHTLFIGRLVNAERYNDKEELVYQYYQNHKDEYIKVKVNNTKTVWVCSLCGYIYEGENIDDDYTCPLCGATKDLFVKKDNENH